MTSLGRWRAVLCCAALTACAALSANAQIAPPQELPCLHGEQLKGPDGSLRSEFSSPLKEIRIKALRSRDRDEVVARTTHPLPQDAVVVWEVGRGDGLWRALGPAHGSFIRFAIPDGYRGQETLFVRSIISSPSGGRAATCVRADAPPDPAADPVLRSFQIK